MHRFKGPSGALENLTANAPCQTEIQNFCQTIGSDNNIRSLQVPMNDAFVVSATESAGDLNAITEDRFHRQSPAFAHRAQGLAFDQFHHDVEVAFSLSDFVNSADVRVSKRGGCPRFVQQTLTCRCVQSSASVHDFHRHVAMQHLVVRAIDGSHSSFANLRHDTAMTENLADHNTLPSPAHTRLRFGRPSTNPSFYVSA